MNRSALRRQAANRYAAAVELVLAEWSPECGGDRPGSDSSCKKCPCLSRFKQLVGQQVCQLEQTALSRPFTCTQNHHD